MYALQAPPAIQSPAQDIAEARAAQSRITISFRVLYGLKIVGNEADAEASKLDAAQGLRDIEKQRRANRWYRRILPARRKN